MTDDQKPSVLLVDGVPIPADVHVSPAPPWASETEKRLLGAWAGILYDVPDVSGSCRHILVVEEIRADGKARIVWSFNDALTPEERKFWGEDTGWGMWGREEDVTISGDTLTVHSISGLGDRITISGGGLLRYKLTAAETLLTETEIPIGFHCALHARMSRIELAALTRPGAGIDWLNGPEFLDSERTEDGKRVLRPKVILFKPKGSGPFPLLVLNHSSYRCPMTFADGGEVELHVADFFLEKGWMVANPQRGEGDWCGFDGALDEIKAAVAALQQRPDVAGKKVLIGGVGTGGLLSVAYAGLHPEHIAGVVNFVGGWTRFVWGWTSDPKINGELFERGARYDRATLWLYGRGDSLFSIRHSQSNFERFIKAGGKGEFIAFDLPDGVDGHRLSCYPELWRGHVEKYLETLEP